MATNDVYCEVCQVGCDTNDVLQQHYLGKKHKKNLEKIESKEELQCEVCQVGCDTIDTLKQHYLGKKHKKNLEKASVNAPRTCSVCRRRKRKRKRKRRRRWQRRRRRRRGRPRPRRKHSSLIYRAHTPPSTNTNSSVGPLLSLVLDFQASKGGLPLSFKELIFFLSPKPTSSPADLDLQKGFSVYPFSIIGTVHSLDYLFKFSTNPDAPGSKRYEYPSNNRIAWGKADTHRYTRHLAESSNIQER
ncbi:hypothetical protein LguiB_012364 [Lonicera macranthoides]